MMTLAEFPWLLRAWRGCRACWAWIRTRFGKLQELERRVAALESVLSDQPAEACPFCGKRAWRLKEAGYSDREARNEIWACLECEKEQHVDSNWDQATKR
jgi:ribosomal protein L37AE/L43A